MVEEMQAIVVKQRDAIQILTAEIMRLRVNKANNPAIYRSQNALRKPIQSNLRFSQHVSRRSNSRTLIESRLEEDVV